MEFTFENSYIFNYTVQEIPDEKPFIGNDKVDQSLARKEAG